MTLQYFTPEGNKALVRHPLNARKQDAVVMEYEKWVKEYGVLQQVRGSPCFVSVRDSYLKWLITNASVTEAVYKAAVSDPSNPQVQATIAAGLQNCTEYHFDMPNDAVIWLRDKHNQFHAGSSSSVMELLDHILLIEKQWSIYRESKGITSREGRGDNAYEKVCWKWINEKHPGVLKSWYLYDAGKSMVHTLQSARVWTDWKDFVASHMNFLEPRLDNVIQVHNMHAITLFLVKHFQATLPPMYFQISLLECLKFSARRLLVNCSSSLVLHVQCVASLLNGYLSSHANNSTEPGTSCATATSIAVGLRQKWRPHHEDIGVIDCAHGRERHVLEEVKQKTIRSIFQQESIARGH